jgi:hypothetical protein
MLFQHFWNGRDNEALWCLSTGCLGTYVEFWHLWNTIWCFTIYLFRKPRTFFLHFPLINQYIFYFSTFQLQFLQNLLRLYSSWKLYSWTSATSWKTWSPKFMFGVPSVSYLVYRISLQFSYGIWSRITFKHWLLYTEYSNVTCFCGMTEDSDR